MKKKVSKYVYVHPKVSCIQAYLKKIKNSDYIPIVVLQKKPAKKCEKRSKSTADSSGQNCQKCFFNMRHKHRFLRFSLSLYPSPFIYLLSSFQNNMKIYYFKIFEAQFLLFKGEMMILIIVYCDFMMMIIIFCWYYGYSFHVSSINFGSKICFKVKQNLFQI